jgi:tRNA threonylcarbamoyladenosine biosynthesis protein TsaE
MGEIKALVKNLEETNELANKIGRQLRGGEVICLIGELGAGKTYFTKFLAGALGIESNNVVSPTFVYWRIHKGKNLILNHFDFYRVESLEDFDMETIGLADALNDEGAVTVIEWADKIEPYLPEERLDIHIKRLEEEKREFVIRPIGDKYQELKY